MMNLNANAGVLGEITAEFFDQSTLTKFEHRINAFLDGLRHGAIDRAPKFVKRWFYKNFKTLYRWGKKTGEDKHKNVICNNGFNALTRLLTGDTTYTGEINKALLGTGVGSASASDTQLITEAYRNDIASATADANIAYLTAFFTEAEVSGTFKEFGNCIDGTASANTGRLWSHIAGLNWVKDTNTALVISCKYTFASV
jgi:hypothetical protein